MPKRSLPVASRMLGVMGGAVERVQSWEGEIHQPDDRADGDRGNCGTVRQHSPRGSIVNQVYVDRAMTAYVLHENEMQAISLMNSLSSLFFSAGSFLFSSAVAIFVSGMFQENMPEIARFSVYYGAPVLTMLSTCCFAAGLWALMKRRSIVRKIQTESRER